MTRRSPPPYPWRPEQAQSGVSKPYRTTKTTRNRLNRGGNRQANAALYRVVIVRMRTHQPTLDYVQRRKAEGKSKLEIIRCLKRFVVREIYGYLCRSPNTADLAKTDA